MRILVTGATGFIGKNLVAKLKSDHDVYALVRYTTGRYVLGESHDVKVLYGDLREPFRINEIVKYVQPEAVVHLGAMSAQSYSYGHPHETIETNFFSTINLSEACRKLVPHFKHFVMAGTAEEYSVQPYGVPIKEDAPLKSQSPYSVSKIASDLYLQYMRDGYDFPSTVMRGFNTYGRVDNKHFLVERVVTQMLNGEEVRLGDPEPVIDWVYVSDHVDAYVSVLEHPEQSIDETFNICSGVGTSVEQLALKVADLTEWKGTIEWRTVPKRPVVVKWLVGDPCKAEAVLGWKAKVSLDEGLKRTVDYWCSPKHLSSSASPR